MWGPEKGRLMIIFQLLLKNHIFFSFAVVPEVFMDMSVTSEERAVFAVIVKREIQAKPKFYLWGGDLSEAPVDVPLSVNNSSVSSLNWAQ
jgi:hypothetical protein